MIKQISATTLVTKDNANAGFPFRAVSCLFNIHFDGTDTSYNPAPQIALKAQRFRQYLGHMLFFSLLNILIVSHKPLHMGLQLKLKHSNKKLNFDDCMSNSRYKDKDYMKDMTFIWVIPVIHAENPVQIIVLQSPVSPDKFIVTLPPVLMCMKLICICK